MMRRLLRGLAILLVLAVSAGGGAVWLGQRIYLMPGPLASPETLVVPRGSNWRVATALRDAGVLRSRVAFEIAAIATRGEGALHAAEFAFPAHASLRAVLAVLRTGRAVQHRITIPEGLTAAEIARIVSAAPDLTGETPVPLEGAVLPQTYDYVLGLARASLLHRMAAAMDVALDRAWRGRDPGIGLASPGAMLTLASIVERETGVPAERPMVAAVFLNRLRMGMKLQSDPTAAYVPSGGLGALNRRLTRADLEARNPYNTYAVSGLPPGPICSPGVAALLAVAHPAPTSALYFVATGQGGHAFADTLAEHQRNVARLRAVVAARCALPSGCGAQGGARVDDLGGTDVLPGGRSKD